MKNFSISNLLAVARWDLTINRAFYIKLFMVIASCCILPVLFYYATWAIDVLGGTAKKPFSHEVLHSNVTLLFLIIAMFGNVAITVAGGFMFHNLKSRQGRIMEFTLPASNLERFVWHALVVMVGIHIVYFVSLFAADVLHNVFAWILFDTDGYTSLSSQSLKFSYFEIPTLMLMETGFELILYIANILCTLCCVSVFPLINAWKYRNNIAYTILFYILGWLFVILLMVLGVVVLRVFPFDVWKLFTDFLNAMHSLGSWCIPLILYVLFLSILCLIWRCAYRLYCKAQLTTSRNP